MKDDYVRITLRIPAGLHLRMVAIAKNEDRSLHKQMIKLMQMGADHLAPNEGAPLTHQTPNSI